MHNSLINLVQAISLTLALLLAFFICTTIPNHSIFDETSAILQYTWGQIMLADLYIGFVVFFCFVLLLEKSLTKAFLWLVPTLFIGNIIPLLYVALSAKSLVQKKVETQ